MTFRAVILGIALGLAVSLLAQYNDEVIQQSSLVGSQYPLAVFAMLAALALVIGPVLGRWWAPLALKPVELAVVGAIGLAACGATGPGFLGYFTTQVVMPGRVYPTRADWQAAEAMSYVPGGSPRLAQGHVRDWVRLSRQLVTQAQDGPDSMGGYLLTHMNEAGRSAVKTMAQDGRSTLRSENAALRALNQIIESAPLAKVPAWSTLAASMPAPAEPTKVEIERRNRALLVAAFPEELLPIPSGSGALMLGGRTDDPDVRKLWERGSTSGNLAFYELPWAKWWPSIRLWGGVFLCLALASLGLALIMHPQWSRRELLTYPVAQVADAMIRRAPGRLLPDIARHRLFWIGVAAMLAFHGINALQAWFPNSPLSIPRVFNFSPLQELFPGAAKINMSWGLFWPKLFPSLVAFAYLLATEVSLSLGLSLVIWVAFAALLMSQGVAMTDQSANFNLQNMLLFGAYLGQAAMIFYNGRRYYLSVCAAAAGVWRPDIPGHVMWAARGVAAALLGAVALLNLGGLNPLLAVLVIGMILLLFIVTARMNAEAGVFIVQSTWLPTTVLAGLLGYEAIGPTAMVVATIGTLMYFADSRQTVFGQFTNALFLADRASELQPAKVARWMIVMLVVGFIVALLAVMTLHYNLGLDRTANSWARGSTASKTFDGVARMVGAMNADGTLRASVEASPVARLGMIHASPRSYFWLLVGLALVLGCAGARLRFSWWPLHPVLFLFWGTYPSAMMSASFFLGWLLKMAVVKSAGAQVYNRTKPLVFGILAGELLAALVLLLIGWAYALATKLPPPSYAVYPF